MDMAPDKDEMAVAMVLDTDVGTEVAEVVMALAELVLVRALVLALGVLALGVLA